MRMCRVAEPSARANVGIDDNVQERGRFPLARIVGLEISTEHRGAPMVGIVQLAGHRVLVPTMEVRALLPEQTSCD